MKLQKGEKGDVEVGGFTVPEPGVSICRILEGITEMDGKQDGVVNLLIPLEIDSVLEGPDENKGQKPGDFICLRDSSGKTPGGAERKIGAYLVNTDLIDRFVERFGEDLDALDPNFLGMLKLDLADKFVKVKHSIRKNRVTGQEQFQVDSIGPAGGKTTTSAPSPDSDSGSDW